jgi:hypothetical protein
MVQRSFYARLKSFYQYFCNKNLDKLKCYAKMKLSNMRENGGREGFVGFAWQDISRGLLALLFNKSISSGTFNIFRACFYADCPPGMISIRRLI